MSELFTQWLPHAGAALVVASVATVITRRFIVHRSAQGMIFGAVFLACLIPLPAFSLTHYIRVLTGDLSITGLIILALAAYHRPPGQG